MHRIDPMNRERATAVLVDFCNTKLRFQEKNILGTFLGLSGFSYARLRYFGGQRSQLRTGRVPPRRHQIWMVTQQESMLWPQYLALKLSLQN